ncbi:MAG: hypothetical protein RBU37_14030 [Myxococcota bacterium]|jgi:hypothetical protein|nr:hypothetical protein [Myxococcota bacterium]
MSDSVWVVETVTRTSAILQAALQVHERMEFERGVFVVRELCLALDLDPDAVPMSTVATAVFTLAVFSNESWSSTQEDFSSQLMASLDDADARLLLRQCRSQAARAVRCVRQARPVLRALSGPNRRRDEAVDWVVDLSTGSLHDSGCFMGWTVSLDSRRLFLAGAVLEDAAREAIEQYSPLSMPLDESLFWTEHARPLWTLAIDPGAVMRHRRFVAEEPMFHEGQSIFISGTQQPQVLLERILLACDYDGMGRSFSSLTLKRVRHLRSMIAKARNEGDVEALVELFKSLRYSMMGWRAVTLSDGRDGAEIESILPMSRIFEAFALRPDASVMGAERSSLSNLPCALLLLPDEHVLYTQIHPMDSIRVALEQSERMSEAVRVELEQAFEGFVQERRLCASYAIFDLSQPKQLERLDYGSIMGDLREVFAPLFFEQELSRLGLSARIVGRLDAALRSQTGRSPCLKDLPLTARELLQLRQVGANTITELRGALLGFADAWRARLCGLDPRSLQVGVASSAGSTDALADGLAALAALFEVPGQK